MNDFTDRVVREYNIAVDCANQAGEYIDEPDYLVSENKPQVDQRHILLSLLNTSFRANRSFHRINLWTISYGLLLLPINLDTLPKFFFLHYATDAPFSLE